MMALRRMKTPIPRLLLWLICLLWIGIAFSSVAAQDTGVYVTTQDYSSLRTGADESFERLAIVPPATTLPAIGRSVRSNWLQVEYEGQRGWIWAGLLVWSGDVLTLPVDGIDPEPFIRRQLVTARFTSDAPIYTNEVVASDQVGVLPIETEVELIGRLGGESNGMFWVQILHEGQQYWTGSWNLRLITGNYGSLRDKSYLFAYGRLTLQIGADIYDTERRLQTIEGRWLALQGGQQVACDPIDLAKTSQATERDARSEPEFGPALTALDTAIDKVNSSIAAFEDACNRTETFVTTTDIRTALDDTATARRNLNLSRSFVNALDDGNPVLGQ
jgi:hypothetical protein